MSNFMMIFPEGWVELPDGQAFVDTHSESQLLDLISYGNMAAIEAMLQDMGALAIDAPMLDFRMFRDGLTYRIWYKVS